MVAKILRGYAPFLGLAALLSLSLLAWNSAHTGSGPVDADTGLTIVSDVELFSSYEDYVAKLTELYPTSVELRQRERGNRIRVKDQDGKVIFFVVFFDDGRIDLTAFTTSFQLGTGKIKAGMSREEFNKLLFSEPIASIYKPEVIYDDADAAMFFISHEGHIYQLQIYYRNGAIHLVQVVHLSKLDAAIARYAVKSK